LSDKEAEITIRLHNGRTARTKVNYPGDRKIPVGSGLDEKARGLLESIFEKERVEAILKNYGI
jgi:hypothetical protein